MKIKDDPLHVNLSVFIGNIKTGVVNLVMSPDFEFKTKNQNLHGGHTCVKLTLYSHKLEEREKYVTFIQRNCDRQSPCFHLWEKKISVDTSQQLLLSDLYYYSSSISLLITEVFRIKMSSHSAQIS